jgi:diguanylate cyclase (GGDEF)-like protein/PAS domain S-box-containing protein
VVNQCVAKLKGAPHWAYLAANVPLVALIFLFLPYHTFLWGAMGWGGVAAIVIGIVKYRPRHKLPWILIAMALGTFISGDITYDVLTKYLHERNPFPSIADLFYLLTYPLLAVGLVGLVRARRQERDSGALLDALIVTSGAALLSWIFLIQPYVHAQDMSLFVKTVSVAYPLGDILLLCLLARLLAGGGVRNVALRFLTVGGVGLLAADCVYGWIQLNGNWKVGGPTDLGWVGFYVLWGAAALHPSMRELTEKQPRRSRNISVSTLLALSVATLVGPLLLVWRVVVDGQARDAGMIAGVTAAEFVLVMARMTGLARAQAVLARREHALREFGERLVAATELEEVLAAAMAAVGAMLGAVASVCILTSESSKERVILSVPTGFEGLEVLVEEASESTPAEVLFVGVTPRDLADRWTSIPVSERSGRRYRILICHGRPLPLDVVAILDAVAAQFVIALERVEVVADRHQRQGAARFRSLIQNASDVIVVAQPGGSWSSETPSIEQVLGYPRGAAETLDVGKLLHPEDATQAMVLVEAMLSGSRSGPIRTEWRVRHADGRWLQMEVIANDLSRDPAVGGVVLTLRDVTDRRLLEEEVRHRAFHDGLTDLANRVLFNDRVEQALSRVQRQSMSVSVLFLDVDDFKLVNDSLGHAAGDELLVQVGRRLKDCIREGDTAARLGGDEFAVCAESNTSNPLDLTGLATRILDTFKVPFALHGTEVSACVSIGISTSSEKTRTAADMLREADLALYAVKNAGKGTFRFFEPELHEEVLTKLGRRAALENAIKCGELRLHYQPIVRLTDRAIIGMEALVRWQHPVEGLVPPLDFIPLAEESGLIVPLGEWVLQQACTDLSRWQRSWPGAWGTALHVNVNLSPPQLRSGRLLEVIDNALAEHGVEPSSLTLEITESCFAEDSDEVRLRVQALDERGITFSLDDFGTGYSSLSYLRRFPLRSLKIDRSFVNAMDTIEGLILLNAIMSMAHGLGLSVVAEGIEDEDQARELRRLGCDEGQGYLFWRPMTAEAVDELLDSTQRQLATTGSLLG